MSLSEKKKTKPSKRTDAWFLNAQIGTRQCSAVSELCQKVDVISRVGENQDSHLERERMPFSNQVLRFHLLSLQSHLKERN